MCQLSNVWLENIRYGGVGWYLFNVPKRPVGPYITPKAVNCGPPESPGPLHIGDDGLKGRPSSLIGRECPITKVRGRTSRQSRLEGGLKVEGSVVLSPFYHRTVSARELGRVRRYMYSVPIPRHRCSLQGPQVS